MLTRAITRAFSTEGLKVFNNVAKQQFTITLHGQEASLTYDKAGKNITYLSTDVPDVFQGKGVGKILAKYAFNYAVQNDLDVTLNCSFLIKYYEENRNEYKSLNVKSEQTH